MTWPFGKPYDGQGTTLTELSRILGARWATKGVIGGCECFRQSTAYYRYDAGAVVVDAGEGRRWEVAVEAGEVQCLPAPASGTRIDYVFVDVDGAVRVTSDRAAIGGGALLQGYRVPAGATRTLQHELLMDYEFALPRSAATGDLVSWSDPWASGTDIWMDDQWHTRFETTLGAPVTDRSLEVEITQCMAFWGDKTSTGSCAHRILLDGAEYMRGSLPISFGWNVMQMRIPFTMPAWFSKKFTYQQQLDYSNPAGGDIRVFVNGAARGRLRIVDKGAIQ